MPPYIKLLSDGWVDCGWPYTEVKSSRAAGVHADLGNLYHRNFLCTLETKYWHARNDDIFFSDCMLKQTGCIQDPWSLASIEVNTKECTVT